jgi:methionine sulfoxide reductase catalytic subunit
MLIKRRRGWELPTSSETPEGVYLDRRMLLKGMAAAGLSAAGPSFPALAQDGAREGSAGGPYPVPRNPAFMLDRPVTDEDLATSYNNFYEFGSQKNIKRLAQNLTVRPWTVRIDGMVEQEREVDFEDLLKAMPLEERLYRLRCVEAWAMAVPWSGFPLKSLVDYARPLGSATYLRMETFLRSEEAGGQRQFWYPWPYVEGLSMAEATNELAFIATGLYGKEIPKQNGAPLRLVVPWKYGFKSVKSIARFTFTDKRPTTFWEATGPGEYGFWANVNPEVPHPRWSQAEERMLGTNEMRPTRIFNGYGEWVAGLYKGLEEEKLYM